MTLALEEAKKARVLGEVPIGAVVVYKGQVIAAAHNRRELDQNPTAHAEILAIQKAAEIIGSWRLVDCSLYVTLEPCPMCAGALVNARVSRVVFGAKDAKAGALRSLYAIGEDPRLNHLVDVRAGVLAVECGAILTDFFRDIRRSKSSIDAEE